MASDTTSGTKGVFLRQSSGVVRAMSPRDGMYFGYLSAAGLYGVTLFFFLGPGEFPGGSVLVACLLNLLIGLFIFGAYAMLGSAMPRSGGDYVYQSRLLSPVVGFTATFAGLAFWQFFYAFLAASTIVTGGLVPLLSGIGAMTGDHGWISASNWLANSHVELAFTIVFLLISAVIMIRGMRLYLGIQKYFMIAFTMLAIVIIAIGWLVVSHSTFVAHFNKFEHAVGGLSATQVVSKAAALGYHQHVPFSWGNTLALTALLGIGSYLSCMWQTELLGEMKSARNLGRLFASMMGAAVLLTITYLIAFVWTYAYVGQPLMGSFSFLAFGHSTVLGGGWAFRGVQSFFLIPTLNVVLAILIFLGFLGPISQSMFNTTLASSRIYLSQSFDRVLPAWMGQVNKRGAPANAIWFGTAISIALAVVFLFRPSLTEALAAGYMFLTLGLMWSLLGAIVFPYRMKETYEASPASRFKVGSIPLISILGVVGFAFMIFTVVEFLTQSAFGILSGTAAVSWITAGVLVAATLVYYFVISAVRKRAGIDLRWAFQTVPPE
jgi:basic amino acid/polyamine antiporter, APA family